MRLKFDIQYIERGTVHSHARLRLFKQHHPPEEAKLQQPRMGFQAKVFIQENERKKDPKVGHEVGQ